MRTTRGQQGRPSTETILREQEAKGNPVAALDMALQKAAPRLAEIVPRHVDPSRVIQLALSNAIRDPKLLECTTSSMLVATAQIAALGLEPGTALQQAYLVPRRNRKKVGDKWADVYEATAIIGYRGFILIAYESEGIDVLPEIVRTKDHFRELGGLSPVLEHSKSEEIDPGELRGAYAVWTLRSGRSRHLWWTARELFAHRDRFAPRSSYDKGAYIERAEDRPITGPWAEHFEAMCLKTVVRAAAKFWPLSSERIRGALAVDDAGERGRVDFEIMPGIKANVDRVKQLAEELGEVHDLTEAPASDPLPTPVQTTAEGGAQ